MARVYRIFTGRMKTVRPILYHCLFWIIIMMSFAISEWSYRENFKEAIIFELLYLPARLIAVYVNWFVLIPRILFKNKLIAYFLWLGIILFVLGVLHRYFLLYWGYPTYFPHWMTGEIRPWDIPRLFQAILIIISPVAFTTGFKLFINWYHSKQEAEQLKQEKKEAELKFLKAQINPHFLFNSLNSIYGLSLAKSDDTPKLILKLSNILDYSLYDAITAWVPLEKEIHLIEDIIDLEKARFGKRVTVTFEVQVDQSGHLIPPLLLIPLVENAFKHGIKEEIDTGWITISLQVKDAVLNFQIQNSLPDKNGPFHSGGLGLKNVARRLELLYGGQGNFHYGIRGSVYSASLMINDLAHGT